MKPVEPLQLNHSWSLFDREQHFNLGRIHNCSPLGEPYSSPLDLDTLTRHGVGQWQCDLAEDTLAWSDGVYDIFGLPHGAALSRPEIVALYCEESRAAMERLRAYAIKHRRGFTLDAEIKTVNGRRRWMRLIAAPVYENGQAVRIEGLKINLPIFRRR